MSNNYEIIPIGFNCKISIYLKNNNLRYNSYPLDYVITKKLSTINIFLRDQMKHINYFSNIKDYSDNQLFTKYFGASANCLNIIYVNNNYQGLIVRHHDILKNDYELTLKRIYKFEQLLNNINPFKSYFFVRECHDDNVNKRFLNCNIDDGNNLNDLNINDLLNDVYDFFNIFKNRNNIYLILITDNLENFDCLKNITTIKNLYVYTNNEFYNQNKFKDFIINLF